MKKSLKDSAIARTAVIKQVTDALKELITSSSFIDRVSWNQYTPYFNDGSELTFGVNDFCVILSKEGEALLGPNWEPDMYSNETSDEPDAYSLHEITNALESTTDILNFKDLDAYRALIKNVKKIESFLNDNPEELKLAFSDHANVTVSHIGIRTTSYEHD